jgi:hypothetical protein
MENETTQTQTPLDAAVPQEPAASDEPSQPAQAGTEPVEPRPAQAGTDPDEPQPGPEAAAATPLTVTAPAGPDIKTLVDEAERRGYLKGRNEQIERLMASPGIWEPEPQPEPLILNRPRRSVWD